MSDGNCSVYRPDPQICLLAPSANGYTARHLAADRPAPALRPASRLHLRKAGAIWKWLSPSFLSTELQPQLLAACSLPVRPSNQVRKELPDLPSPSLLLLRAPQDPAPPNAVEQALAFSPCPEPFAESNLSVGEALGSFQLWGQSGALQENGCTQP